MPADHRPRRRRAGADRQRARPPRPGPRPRICLRRVRPSLRPVACRQGSQRGEDRCPAAPRRLQRGRAEAAQAPQRRPRRAVDADVWRRRLPPPAAAGGFSARRCSAGAHSRRRQQPTGRDAQGASRRPADRVGVRPPGRHRSDVLDCVKALLEERGAELLNQQTTCGCTALSMAAEEGKSMAVGILIQSKADVNLPIKDGSTALMHASKGGTMARWRRCSTRAPTPPPR